MPEAPRLRDVWLSWLVLLKQLPGYLPFVPLIARSLSAREAGAPAAEAPGALTRAEREWLTALVRRTPDDAVIVQAGPPEVDATCALAAGCWASGRRVLAAWPAAAWHSAPLRAWHRAIVRQNLAPYVKPVVAPATCDSRADLLYGDPSETWARRLRAGAIVVLASTATGGPPGLSVVEACGGLTAVRVTAGATGDPQG